VRCVDALESAAERYVTLDDVRRECGVDHAQVDVIQAALEDDLLLVDERRRLEGANDALSPVRLCRLNRRHPLVRQLLAW
jgi:hypothetical protein